MSAQGRQRHSRQMKNTGSASLTPYSTTSTTLYVHSADPPLLSPHPSAVDSQYTPTAHQANTKYFAHAFSLASASTTVPSTPTPPPARMRCLTARGRNSAHRAECTRTHTCRGVEQVEADQ